MLKVIQNTTGSTIMLILNLSMQNQMYYVVNKRRPKKKFYYHNDKLIAPLSSDINYDLEEEVNVFTSANELLNSAKP
ncbi:hypothetical protein FLAN108750_01060 [Flavobacterium antarcticum]